MKIVILGWGSLIWNPGDLPREGTWQTDGPTIAVEFSRVSRDCRLTLVIDRAAGADVVTRYILSPRAMLADAVDDLMKREGTTRANIGFVDLKNDQNSNQKFSTQPDVFAPVREWCALRGYDAAVWTALPSNFKQETGSDFSVDSAIAYLNGLPQSARSVAFHYIDSAPEKVITPLRRKRAELASPPSAVSGTVPVS